MKQAYRSGIAFIFALHFYFRSQLQKNINNYTRAPYIDSLSLILFLELISYTRNDSTCFCSSHNIKNELKTPRFRLILCNLIIYCRFFMKTIYQETTFILHVYIRETTIGKMYETDQNVNTAFY